METGSMGAFLAVLRKEHGLTQRQLAEELHVSEKSISRWERDETSPDLAMIPVLAERFGVTADELLRGQRRKNGTSEYVPSEDHTADLLKKTITQYGMRSMITICIALCGGAAGVLLVMDGKQRLGLVIGIVAQVVAALIQTAFTMGACSAVDAAQYRGAALYQARKRLLRIAFWVYTHGVLWLALLLVLPIDEFHIGLLVLCVLGLALWIAQQGVTYYLTRRGFFFKIEN